jgi:hypothetical protein
VVIVLAVISGDSGRRDRIEKVREYAAVPSIRRYVIVECVSKGLLAARACWSCNGGTVPPRSTALALTEDDTLDVPEVGITVPAAELYVAELYLADLYEDVDFADGAAGG